MASPFLPVGATTGDSGGELSSGEDSGDVESLQSPETESPRSLTELFEKAAAHLQGLIHVASREQLLYLYARYKQVKSQGGRGWMRERPEASFQEKLIVNVLGYWLAMKSVCVCSVLFCF